jgi:hypothetical protein
VGYAAPSPADADLPEDANADAGNHFQEILKGMDYIFCINLTMRLPMPRRTPSSFSVALRCLIL